jgi:hypothetical protein
MKKKIIAIAIATMMAVPAMAQVFLDDEDLNNRAGSSEVPGAIIPEQDVTYDQFQPYVPVGEGILLLAGLAGAYLVGKRKKED